MHSALCTLRSSTMTRMSKKSQKRKFCLKTTKSTQRRDETRYGTTIRNLAKWRRRRAKGEGGASPRLATHPPALRTPGQNRRHLLTPASHLKTTDNLDLDSGVGESRRTRRPDGRLGSRSSRGPRFYELLISDLGEDGHKIEVSLIRSSHQPAPGPRVSNQHRTAIHIRVLNMGG
jgi:hypothetical protein